MFGGSDPIYILARRVLLDALEALGEQRDAIILVGAQAIYLHTGDADLAVATFTTDGDIAIDPSRLKPDPKLEEALSNAGFEPDIGHVGTYIMSRTLEGSRIDVKSDLLVPEAVGGPGRRGARLGPHGNRAARKVKGLEAALVDRHPMQIDALEEDDHRAFRVAVASPAALLVAKLHKIADRADTAGRSEDKDALDVLRLLRAIPTQNLASSIQTLQANETSANVTKEAIAHLRDLFSEPSRTGCRMAARAAAPLEPEDTITTSCAFLAGDLLRMIES